MKNAALFAVVAFLVLLAWSLVSHAQEIEVLIMRPGETRTCKDAEGCVMLTVQEVRELMQYVHLQTMAMCGKAI